MKKIRAVVMGFGDRGQIYASYAKRAPEKFEVVGCVDPDPVRLEKARREYGLGEEFCFGDPKDFYARGKFCDAVVNATMDALHVKTTLPLLDMGYDVLLEKPVTGDPAELFALGKKAQETGRTVMVCHVLRYAPFYRRVKEILLSGEVGEIEHIYASENVAVYHMLSSYVRGKWASESECGSSMLMAKCCHDLDLIVWLTGGAKPRTVASLGTRSVFTSARKPPRAGTRCLACAVERDCPYSARRLYLENDVYPFLVWTGIPGRDWSEITGRAEREKLLESSNPHGVCAFRDRDLVDHQSVIMQFENGITATLDMTGGAARPGRNLHVVGTKGEIEGFLESNRFFVRTYDPKTTGYHEREIVVDEDVSGAHSGGDLRLVEDFVRTLRGCAPSVSCTSLADSVTGHLATMAADLSRREGKTVSFDGFCALYKK